MLTLISAVSDALRGLTALVSSVVSRTLPQRPGTPLAEVVIVPGVYENWTFLRAIATSLAEAGYAVSTVPELRRNALNIPEAASLVSAQIETLTTGSPVVLVAHSKGGLIGKRVLLDDIDGRVAGLVAIATPFRGSPRARLIPGRTLRELRPGSASISALNDDRVNGSIITITPRQDAFVADQYPLPGATNLAINARGHFASLATTELRNAVVVAVGELSAAAR